MRTLTWRSSCAVATLFALLLLLPGCKPADKGPGGTPAAGTGGERTGGVVLLRYTPGSESTTQREEGFLDALRDEYPDVVILSDDQYLGTTQQDSIENARQILIKEGDRITGMFAVCEPNAHGALLALEREGKAGKVKFVGFDPNDRMVKALREGQMQGIVLQDPVGMGGLAVKAMVAHLEGGKLPIEAERLFEDGKLKKRVATGEFVATPENMNDDEMRRLLSPPQHTGADYAPENAKYRIAVIPKGTTHEFWNSVRYGANAAAKELTAAGVPVEIIYKGPILESDRQGQISLMRQFINDGVDGICLAPLDSGAMAKPVEEAQTAGIPTVVFDSGLDAPPETYVSFVATDNVNGGALAAKCLAEALGVERTEQTKATK
ncbi:substrate-binding domain-containing protein [Lignipirellula cremea]|uniref:substrate-binding domain-containing protein n=1 Tax=Lignipirellula cremea TaxID=2528010 RepID=UPI0018D27017|nr:substrate-binding domain-containing protein [Lignipirellula cremea]